MSSASKVSLSLGDWKLELEGEKAFVEQKLKELLPLIVDGFHQTKTPGAKQEGSHTDKKHQKKRGQSLKSFMDEKKPLNSSQAIAVAMYYKREHEGNDELSADEIRNGLRQAGYRPPGNVAQALVDCKRRFGYIERGTAKGMWKLVHQGEALVEFDMPENVS